MYKKILIANRGEIALRIIRACHELGIKSVAVYSTADKSSLHTKFADEAVCIGPPQSSESYLSIPSIISAGEITNSDAIHPGYGFLAENADFSQICSENNFAFIGPKPEIINAMGDKSEAKKTMKSAGVPVIPGNEGILSSPSEAKLVAKDIGYPVMLKASAGGGGRGMRLVYKDSEIENAFITASSEARNAFNNGDMYIEKFVENPRHIEIQILADAFGNIVSLGERECSIQRRYQKLVEESPSPAVDEDLRKKMGEAAIAGAKAVGYIGVGTVEFLLDKNKDFYFMEMNTRIQVEHPITEMVTGADLIKWQIRTHAGDKFPDYLYNMKLRGHSIECRINAEDPDKNFSPSAIPISSFHMPGGKGVRIDSHAYAGYKIPPYYDSLLGKLIVHSPDRKSAINRMERALEETIIEGPKTTIPFHQAIMKDERYRSGNFDTNFLKTFKYKEGKE
ncbi:MAG: acetyl-CoA carboxylase biotin carboxylase subunit [Candidatus Neomarinimicrobiota bacterium]|nr:MAG: acetyl-CoA carboxylase biotin carboxylase subunit [bacterium]